MQEVVRFYCAECRASRKFLRAGKLYRCEVCGRVVHPKEPTKNSKATDRGSRAIPRDRPGEGSR